MDPSHPRPIVLVSRCLGFAACRYDGQMLKSDFVDLLKPHVEMIPVCPEADCGLGIPRPPIRLYRQEGEMRVHQPATGREVTGQLNATIDAILAGHRQIDGAILKSKSPSCGLSDTKIYEQPDQPRVAGKGAGLFGGRVMAAHPGRAVEDEMRLTNLALREHFLIKLFALARFRLLAEQPAMGELVEFHASHKLLLLAYNQSRFRMAGKIVANHERLPAGEVFHRYGEQLAQILDAPLRIPSVINTLYHALGWVTGHLGPEERQLVINSIEEYRDERLPLAAVTRLLEAHALRAGRQYVRGQLFFRPYPRALAGLSDTGRGRAVR